MPRPAAAPAAWALRTYAQSAAWLTVAAAIALAATLTALAAASGLQLPAVPRADRPWGDPAGGVRRIGASRHHRRCPATGTRAAGGAVGGRIHCARGGIAARASRARDDGTLGRRRGRRRRLQREGA